MSDTSKAAAAPSSLRDPDYRPPLAQAVPLGLQHVLAMFAGNVTVPIIIAGAAGLGGDDKVFLIQIAMLIAGVATLVQTIGLGPVGARLPIVQGTSFAFIPVMIPIVKTAGLGAVFGAIVGLIFMNAEFSFMAILGFLSLAGIIVNNGIVLIDRIDIERDGGLEPYDAIVTACVARFRPIFMTTLTTILGYFKGAEMFEVLGVPWDRRAARTEEYVAVMRALWAEDNASFDGEFVSFSGMSSNPKPARGSVPITIGGHSRAAAERAGRIGDGVFPAKGDMAELIDIVRTTAADHDRDPAAIEVTGVHPGVFGADPGAAVEEAASWGLDRLSIPAFLFFKDPETSIAAMGEALVAPHAD